MRNDDIIFCIPYVWNKIPCGEKFVIHTGIVPYGIWNMDRKPDRYVSTDVTVRLRFECLIMPRQLAVIAMLSAVEPTLWRPPNERFRNGTCGSLYWDDIRGPTDEKDVGNLGSGYCYYST
jgi:hypothetical protein